MVHYIQPSLLVEACSPEAPTHNLGTMLVEVIATVLDNEVSSKILRNFWMNLLWKKKFKFVPENIFFLFLACSALNLFLRFYTSHESFWFFYKFFLSGWYNFRNDNYLQISYSWPENKCLPTKYYCWAPQQGAVNLANLLAIRRDMHEKYIITNTVKLKKKKI